MGFRHQVVGQADVKRGDARHRLANDAGRRHIARFGRRVASLPVPRRELFQRDRREVR